jgi:TldD protein
VDLTPDAAAQAARQAVEVARVAAAMNTEPIELAPEPAYGEVTWVSAYDVDPFTVSVADKVALLSQWSRDLLAHPAISHVDASLQQVRECKFYSDGATTAIQQRVRLHPAVTAIAVTGDGRFVKACRRGCSRFIRLSTRARIDTCSTRSGQSSA